MAQSVFITQEPTIVNVTKNPMVFVLSSANVVNSQYQYVLDVRTQPDNQLVGRFKQYPNPSGASVFDVSHVVDDYLSPNPNNFKTTQIQSVSGSEFKFFKVTAGEEFGTSPSSSVTLYDGNGGTGAPAVTGSNDGLYGGWGGSMDVMPGNTSPNGGWNFGDYFGTSSMSYILSSFVTTEDKASAFNHKMGPNDYGLMPIIDTDSIIDTDTTTIALYNSNNGLIKTIVLPNTNASQWINYIPVGTQNLIDSGDATQTDINNTAWYKVSTIGSTSFTKTFTVEHCQSNYERINFMFINKWGVWENYGLNQPLKKSTEITREEMIKSRIPYSFGSADASYTQRGGDYYNSNYVDSFSISTPYVNTKEANFIAELIESPQVFLQVNDLDMGLGVTLSEPTFVPIQITNSSYIAKSNKLQKVFKYDIEYKLSNQRPSR